MSGISDRLAALADLFDAKEFSPTRSELYFDALADLPLEIVRLGLNAAARSCVFMPKPAEIRKLAAGDSEDQAERAWLAWRSLAHRSGASASLIVEDAALAETIFALFGSWPEACALELSAEMWAAKRKEFGRVYRVMRDRHPIGGRYLPGTCELHNAQVAAWVRFTPVYRLGAEGEHLKRLTAEEAEHARAALATSGSRQLLGAAATKQLRETADSSVEGE